VPDDADGDGTITTGERVLLLKTSKIAAASDGVRSLRRGVDLSAWGRSTVAEESHATAVLGTLVGGQDLLFRRHRGLVPDAEVLLFNMSVGTIAEGAAWARDEGAQVLIHEYASYYRELDGTSYTDEIVNESTAEGVINVCGMGNAGAASKHAVSVARESPHVATVHVPPPDDTSSVTWLWIHTHWRDPGVTLDCTLTTPYGEPVPLVPGTTDSRVRSRAQPSA
jgi:hypothetical protein